MGIAATVVAPDIANEEQMHVRLLRTALGSAAIAQPAINLAALGIGFANAVCPETLRAKITAVRA